MLGGIYYTRKEYHRGLNEEYLKESPLTIIAHSLDDLTRSKFGLHHRENITVSNVEQRGWENPPQFESRRPGDGFPPHFQTIICLCFKNG